MAAHSRGGVVETRGDRAALAHHAGMGRVSLVSVLAGVLVAYGAFAVLLAITAAVAESAGLDADLSANEWRDLGTAGGAVVAGVLLLCYLFGGYVAGRMARRAGATNGVMVFVLGLLVAVGVTGLVNVFTDGDDILRNLRNVGIPTSGEEWEDVATVAGIGSLVAMFLGSLLGGVLGERWHAKLLARAADPTIGPEAAARAEAEHHRRELEKAEERARGNRLDPATAGTTPATNLDADVDGDLDRTRVGYADADVASPGTGRRFTTVDDDVLVGTNGANDGDGLDRAERRRLRGR